MNQFVNMVLQALLQVDAIMGHADAVRALISSFVMAVCITQIAKRAFPAKWLSDKQYKLVVRLLAFVIGTLSCWLLWPVHDIAAIIISIMTGMSTPFIYKIVVRTLCHFFPWIDGSVSGRPTHYPSPCRPPEPPRPPYYPPPYQPYYPPYGPAPYGPPIEPIPHGPVAPIEPQPLPQQPTAATQPTTKPKQ